MSVTGPSSFTQQQGDYKLGDYQGLFQSVGQTVGSLGYRIDTNCCCSAQPGPAAACCGNLVADMSLAGRQSEWYVSNPCFNATLIEQSATLWVGFGSCTPNGGFPVTVDLRIQCKLNEADGYDQYWLSVQCNNPNTVQFEQWSGFLDPLLSDSSCPDSNDPGYPCGVLSRFTAFFGPVPPICGVVGGQMWGAVLRCK